MNILLQEYEVKGSDPRSRQSVTYISYGGVSWFAIGNVYGIAKHKIIWNRI